MQTNISKIYKDMTILNAVGTGYVSPCLTKTLLFDCNLKVLNNSSSFRALYGFFRLKINNY